jgi:hypothetical protein
VKSSQPIWKDSGIVWQIAGALVMGLFIQTLNTDELTDEFRPRRNLEKYDSAVTALRAKVEREAAAKTIDTALPPASLSDRIALRASERTAKALTDRLNGQRRELVQTQQLLAKTRGENDALESVLSTNRLIVERILAAEYERVRKDIWNERFIGFVLGVASSLVASAIGSAFRRRNTPSP